MCFPPLSLSDPEHRSVNALRMTLATDGLGYRSELGTKTKTTPMKVGNSRVLMDTEGYTFR